MAQHERAAEEQADVADAHRDQYDPDARTAVTECGPHEPALPICWTSVVNPTAQHLRAAEHHRRLAAEHRAASATLRNAEARACAGIAPDDRDTSPFDRVDDIASVEPLVEHDQQSGAVVTFRAVPGVTRAWLQRIIDCHLARSAALGHVIPEMPNCPLVPRGVQARVTSTANGLAVAIRSDDATVAQQILRRARRSLAGS